MRALRKFQMIHGEPSKRRQKLIRYLRLVDTLISVLKSLKPRLRQRVNNYERRVSRAIYKVLSRYLEGESRKNELYVAKYIGFFQEQVWEREPGRRWGLLRRPLGALPDPMMESISRMTYFLDQRWCRCG